LKTGMTAWGNSSGRPALLTSNFAAFCKTWHAHDVKMFWVYGVIVHLMVTYYISEFPCHRICHLLITSPNGHLTL
jgi:hypothetical protein